MAGKLRLYHLPNLRRSHLPLQSQRQKIRPEYPKSSRGRLPISVTKPNKRHTVMALACLWILSDSVLWRGYCTVIFAAGFHGMTMVAGAACFFWLIFCPNNGIITYFLGGYATSASSRWYLLIHSPTVNGSLREVSRTEAVNDNKSAGASRRR
jgi:hypothetical protein